MLAVNPMRLDGPGYNAQNEHGLKMVEADSLLAANIGITWQAQDCHFNDWCFVPSVQLGRDYMPMEIERVLPGSPRGHCLSRRYGPGELLGGRSSRAMHTIALDRIQADSRFGAEPPRIGRFYPCSQFGGLAQGCRGRKSPCRVSALHDGQLHVDCNHPLAGLTLTFHLCIESINPARSGENTRGNDLIAISTDLGPGMQQSLNDTATDFWSDTPFSRQDEGDDDAAFAPRMTPFWDSLALQQVSRFYRAQLTDGLDILDLMAGVHSPLQESGVEARSVTGAGLNQVELDANPVLDKRLVLNVNRSAPLPFVDASFDCVLIHAAFEYVIDPLRVLNEVQRILRPGGSLMISFSNRYVASKAVRIWTRLYEFERIGLLLALLRQSAAFDNFTAHSQRGLPRPPHDELAHKLRHSDPVYLLKAIKKA
jgi:SAM-dependent methyltransferase